MSAIDNKIHGSNQAICNQIKQGNVFVNGVLQSSAVDAIRDFLENVILKVIYGDMASNLESVDDRGHAIEEVRGRENLRFLSEFRDLLQKLSDGINQDKCSAKDIKLKVYGYFFKIKIYMKAHFDMDLLGNLEVLLKA